MNHVPEDRLSIHPPKPHRPSRSRPTIAFLCSPIDSNLNYEKRRVWMGMCEAAREGDADLLYIAGGHFESAPEAVLYRLLDAQGIDGVISWVAFVGSDRETGDLGAYCAFLRRFEPRPVLNIGWAAPGVHNLCFDNLQGMRSVIDHLVQVHRCQRIAYYGLQSASTGLQIRYQAFRQAMTERGLFDPALTCRLPSQLLEPDARWPGRDYEAVIAEGDGEAAELIDAFQSRGVRIPTDVIVTGFHDGQEARLVSPPLTTVHMPYGEMGRRAVRLVLAALAGQEMTEQTFVPVELTVRRSCACRAPLISQGSSAVSPPARSARETAGSQQDHVRDEIARALPVPQLCARRDSAQQLLDALMREVQSDRAQENPAQIRQDFFCALEQLLAEFRHGSENTAAWQHAISRMRQALLPHLQAGEIHAAEDLWHQARILIAQTASRVQAHDTWRDDQRRQVLHQIQADLLVTCDMDELVEILAGKLPDLGISSCCLALYGDPDVPQGQKKMVLAYERGRRIEIPPEGLCFDAPRLFPERVFSPDLRHSLIVNALCVGAEQIGYLAIETDLRWDTRQDVTGDILRRQISSAIKGVTLRQKAILADRLKSRFLSMVSHELRTPLNLLVSLSELTMEEIDRLQSGPDARATARLAHYHQQILNSAHHLDHLILDVLDLAQSQVEQMTLNRAQIDLGEVLREAAVLGESMAMQKDLGWQFDAPPHLPPVYADRTRLRQVLLNLLNNAVKFTASGYVALEAIVAGGQIIISVRDTGLGIPAGDHERIFDEFQQSERTISRGHRGMGLGLAISRRLVELHGGTIGVHSSGEEGRGSTFTLTLPVEGEGTGQDAAAVEPGRTAALLMTRDGEAGRALERQLGRRGIEIDVLALDRLDRWLDYALAARPSAIMLDATLAAEHGWAIAKTLQEHPATRQLPVVLYSLPTEGSAGSVFEIDYVAKDAALSDLARALARYGLHSAETKTILIVDDEPAFLDVYTSIVEGHLPGCRVTRAQNGQEAMRAMRSRPPDLVLLDLMMPRMSGFEVLEAIRTLETTRSVPVIVLTGQTLTESDISRLNQGVGAILSKGLFSPQETIAHIEAALSRDKGVGNEAQRLVRQAIAHVHTRFAEPISCADIAAALHISQDHLIRCFRQELGLTPGVYLSRWRIRQAKELLETTPKSITQIAAEAGFGSQSYFSRVFKNQVGVSPTAYRSGERAQPG